MRDLVSSPKRLTVPVRIALALTVVFVAGYVGSTATLPAIPTWYPTIAKPWWTPPNWIFGPAWTTLYLLMAVAFYRILGQPPFQAGRRLAIAAFLVHMVCNALWSVLFFGMQSAALGVIGVALLWPAALANVFAFWRLDRVAGALLVPNALWVSFASVLTIAIWRMN